MMLRCPQPAELERFLQGQFAEADAAALEAHLRECAGCRRVLDRLTTPAGATDPSSGTDTDQAYEAAWQVRQESFQAAVLGQLCGCSAVEEMAALPVVPGYRIESRLGEGGAGIVYRARHEQLGRPVALKVLRPGTLDRAQGRARFRREAEVLSRLRHPHIVQLFDFGEVGSPDGSATPYMVLELVEGGTLGAKVNHQPLPAPTAAALVETLARALHVVHEQGIIHRDLKPGNILLAFSRSPPGSAEVAPDVTPALLGGERLNDLFPKITDFGLAKQLTGEEAGWTQTRDVLGTPAYMAPEQAGGGKELTPAADVYALGVILYELLTGMPPFRGRDWVELVVQVKEQEPVAPSRLLPGIPRDLETICLKCLHKEPARRYASAEALADDCRRYLDGRPILARPAGQIEKFGKWCRRNPGVAGLSVMVFLLLVVGLAVTTRLYLVAEQQRGETQAALDQVKQEQAQKQQALDRAERNGKQAWQALDELTSNLVRDWLSSQQTWTPEQRQFLTRALVMYQDFARETPTDEASRLRVAHAQARVGNFQGILGMNAEARATLAQARRSWERLAAELPKNPECGRNLAGVRYSQGLLCGRLGEPAEAEQHLRSAVRLNRQLLAAFGADPDTEHQLCETLNALGAQLHQAGRLNEAEQLFRELLPVGRRLATRFPQVGKYHDSLFVTHASLITILQSKGQFAEAEQEVQGLLAYLGSLGGPYGKSTVYRARLAGGRCQHAAILAALGNHEPAEAEYRAGLDILAALVHEQPGVNDYQQALLENRASFTRFLLDIGKLREAESEARAVLATGTPLGARSNTEESERRAASNLHFILARLHDSQDRLDEAEKEYRAALAIWSDRTRPPPSSFLARQELAATHTGLALLLDRLRRFAEAETEFRAALALRKALAAEVSANPFHQLLYGESHDLLGLVLDNAGRPKEAEAEHRRAVAILRPLAARPGTLLYQNSLAGSMVNLARILIQQNQRQEARRWLEEAEPHHQAALAADPHDDVVRRYFRNNRWLLADCLVERGDHAAAARAVEQWVEYALDLRFDNCSAAGCLARCVSLVQKDEMLTAAGRQEQAQKYGARAVELLKLAVAAGFQDAEVLKKDPALEPLRERPDFQKALADLAARNRKP